MRRAAIALALGALALGACDKDKKDPGAQPSTSASASAAPSASAAAPLDAGPSIAKWSGTYTSAPGSFYVPDGPEFKGVKFRGEDAGDGLGEGTISFEVDPTTHVLTGTISGALGDLVLSGTAQDDVTTFNVRPKDPSGMGFTGTGRATPKGTSELEGTIRLSKATANVIREATFSVKRP